ncbi:putative reverse transcriptase domain-containing protein [Tanacetum coccineum]
MGWMSIKRFTSELLNEVWFLELKREWGGRGVKEKDKVVSNIKVVKDGAVPSVTVDFGNAAKEGTTTAGNTLGKSSYANVTGKPSRTKVNSRTLSTPGGNGIDVVVLVESIRAISDRFANTAYGFFLGKRVAYPVVANYVRNTWGSMDGLDAMLENGPWFIRNNPLILRKWHPDVNLMKEDVGTIPVWVKLYGIPFMAFSEDGSSYAKAMIEMRADVELKDNIVVAMPKITGEGYYTCNIHVGYEWKL